LPVSVAFDPDPGGMVRWPADPLSENLPGVQRTRVKLLDIAIVDKAQYPGAYTYSRGSWAGLGGDVRVGGQGGMSAVRWASNRGFSTFSLGKVARRSPYARMRGRRPTCARRISTLGVSDELL
jgi:hypothetical protein